jgi:hypothetical protein
MFEVIDPRDAPYGAKGGGANDTAAFKSALSASQEQGIPLYLPPGKWVMDEITFNPNQPIRVLGAGSNLTTISKLTADGNPIFNVPAIGGAQVFNLQMRMQGFTLNGIFGNTVAGLQLNMVALATISDVCVQNCVNGFSQILCVKNTFESDCIANQNATGFLNNSSELTIYKGRLTFNTVYGLNCISCTETVLQGADVERNGAPGVGGAIFNDAECVALRLRDTWIEANFGPIAICSEGGMLDIQGGEICANVGATYDVYVLAGSFRLRDTVFQTPRPICLWGSDPGVVKGLVSGVIGISQMNVDSRTTIAA